MFIYKYTNAIKDAAYICIYTVFLYVGGAPEWSVMHASRKQGADLTPSTNSLLQSPRNALAWLPKAEAEITHEMFEGP